MPSLRLELLHVWLALPIAPAVNQFPAVGRRREGFEAFGLDRAGPVASFHLHQCKIRGADADDVPNAEGCATPCAAVTRRLWAEQYWDRDKLKAVCPECGYINEMSEFARCAKAAGQASA